MPELRTLPRHKKNPEVGSKEVVYSNELFIEQVDAQSFVLDQEVRPSSLSLSPCSLTMLYSSLAPVVGRS